MMEFLMFPLAATSLPIHARTTVLYVMGTNFNKMG